MSSRPRPVLLDNTVLTNFALINRSLLVFDLWGEACATTAVVLTEYQKAVKQGLLPADIWQKLKALTLSQSEKALADQLIPRLDAGERTCIAVIKLCRDPATSERLF